MTTGQDWASKIHKVAQRLEVLRKRVEDDLVSSRSADSGALGAEQVKRIWAEESAVLEAELNRLGGQMEKDVRSLQERYQGLEEKSRGMEQSFLIVKNELERLKGIHSRESEGVVGLTRENKILKENQGLLNKEIDFLIAQLQADEESSKRKKSGGSKPVFHALETVPASRQERTSAISRFTGWLNSPVVTIPLSFPKERE